MPHTLEANEILKNKTDQKMSSCDLIFKLEQETDKLKTVIFRLFFRAIVRPSGLQKLTMSYFVVNNR